MEFHCCADCLEIGTSTLIYVEHSTPNESTDLPSTMSAPIVPNSTVSSPTDEPIVSEHTPVNLLNADDTSSAPQSLQHVATDMQPLPSLSQSPCPEECTQSIPANSRTLSTNFRRGGRLPTGFAFHRYYRCDRDHYKSSWTSLSTPHSGLQKYIFHAA